VGADLSVDRRMKVYRDVRDLQPLVGQPLGSSDWVEVSQERIQQFADATGDHQWIHLDQERARQGPFGGTIAHGFLTLSLLPLFFASGLRVDGVRMSVNYGLNRVRFPSPVPAGSRLRGHFVLREYTPIDGGVQLVIEVTVSSLPAWLSLSRADTSRGCLRRLAASELALGQRLRRNIPFSRHGWPC